jgi:hypothetical protein
VARDPYDIEFTFSGSKRFIGAFEKAADRWETIITKGLPSVGEIDDLHIEASVVPIDGRGGVLGRAGPTELRSKSLLPYEGVMEFDKADMKAMVADGTLVAVITHEMGHVLGLGSLWETFGFVDEQAEGYTGRHAVAEYKHWIGTPVAPVVPLETGGGPGTAFGHWSETVFTEEMMTGFASGDMPISRMTVGALKDLGYAVTYKAADSFLFDGLGWV